MRRTSRPTTATAVGVAALIALSTSPARSQAVELAVVNVAAVAKGYRTIKLTGKDVVNDEKERIGVVDDFVLGRDDGAVFAILQGSAPGLDGHLVAVPLKSLVLDDPSGKIVLRGATPGALNKLPGLCVWRLRRTLL